MGLRRRYLINIGLLLLGVMGILHAFSQTLLLSSYRYLEEHELAEDLQRVRNALQRSIADLDTNNHDWAAWDDTYRFLLNHNNEYITSNLMDGTFVTLSLNLLLFADASGQLIFAKGYDLQEGQSTAIAEDTLAALTSNALLFHPDEASSITGLVLLPHAVLLLSSRPVLTSNDLGPIQGTMIMGRYLSDEVLGVLSETTRLSLSFHRYDAPQLPIDFQEAQAALASGVITVYTQPLNGSTLVGYTILEDVWGNPALLLRVEVPRVIYALGQSAVSFLLLVQFIIGMTFVIAGVLLTDRLILARVTRLNRGVRKLRETQDFSMPFTLGGNDELSSLAQEFQDLVITVSAYQAKLQATNQQLEQRVEERTRKLTELNERLQQEIAQHRQTQVALQQARDQAMEALNVKTQILANVSHDARTPLNVILLHTQLMQRRQDDAETRQRRLETILLSVNQLEGFFNNLVVEARYKANQIHLTLSAFAPATLLDEVTLVVEPLATQRGLRLRTEIDAALPAALYGDLQHLRQILMNLATNAIKFTTSGEVTIVLRRAGEVRWTLQVTDTGCGIAPEHQEAIFEAFWQVDGSMTRDVNQGVGLGLAIVKQLVTLMHGEITLESQPGVGSTFTVTLPIHCPD